MPTSILPRAADVIASVSLLQRVLVAVGPSSRHFAAVR
jgi:hypothetical protein